MQIKGLMENRIIFSFFYITFDIYLQRENSDIFYS